MNPLASIPQRPAPAKVGSITPTILGGINTGLAVFSQIMAQHAQSAGQHQSQGPRGSGLIDQLAAQYHAAEAQGASADQLIALATQILQVLNDPSLAGTWDNESYRQQAIGVFTHAIQVLQSGNSGVPVAGAIVANGTGVVGGSPVATAPIIGGLSALDMVLIGGASFAIILALRK